MDRLQPVGPCDQLQLVVRAVVHASMLQPALAGLAAPIVPPTLTASQVRLKPAKPTALS